MKRPRSELAPYYNKCIELQGVFKNFYDNIQYEYKEEFKNNVPKQAIAYNPADGLIYPCFFMDKSKCSNCIYPLIFVDKGSVIANVTDCDGALGIFLDHMILQCNIEKTYNIPVGSKVLIYGHIGAYRASNKEGGYDYCIEEILNIKDI